VSRPRDPELPFIPCQEVDLAWMATAPARFENEVDLPVSAERLFELFADPDTWSRWATGIGRVEWTSPPPFGPGTTRTVTFWGGMKVYEDFFCYDAPRQMAFSFYGTTERVWTSFAEHYQVTPTEDGCRLRWTVAYEPAGTFGRLHAIIHPVMAVNLRSYLWRLRRFCQG